MAISAMSSASDLSRPSRLQVSESFVCKPIQPSSGDVIGDLQIPRVIV
jgi:hypothetical protein